MPVYLVNEGDFLSARPTPAWQWRLMRRFHNLRCLECREAFSHLTGRLRQLNPPLTCPICFAKPGVACSCEDE